MTVPNLDDKQKKILTKNSKILAPDAALGKLCLGWGEKMHGRVQGGSRETHMGRDAMG